MNWTPPDELHFPARFPAAMKALALIAIAAGLLGLLHAVDWYFLAVPLAVLVIFAWLSMPRRFALRLYPDRIEHRPSGVQVPYDSITALRLSNRSILDAYGARAAPYFVIAHPKGALKLPHNPAVNRLDLYAWLLGKSRLLDEPISLPGRLAEVRDLETADFGRAQVLSTVGRAVQPDDLLSTKWMWVVTLLAMLGLVIATVTEAGESIVTTFGVITTIFFFFAILVSAARSAQRAALKRLRQGCGVVISPRSLTMESPLLKGALRWSELKDLVVVHKQSPVVSGLLLKIEGGQILVGDNYECPLTEIHRRIATYFAHERQGS